MLYACLSRVVCHLCFMPHNATRPMSALQVMLQQNFQANERRRVKVPEKEMRQKAILYRLASWPNLTRPPPPPSPRPGWRRSPA